MQQMWLVMRVDTPKHLIAIEVSVEADAGSEFRFGGWQIEQGSIADEGMRPREAGFTTGRTSAPEPMRDRLRVRHIANIAMSALQRTFGQGSARRNASTDGLAFALLGEADVRMHAGLFDDAEILLEAGKMLCPWAAELFSHHALCAEMRGHFREAEIRWMEVVRLFPHIALGHYRLAAVLRQVGEVARAADIIERALPDHSGDVALLAESARVSQAAGRLLEASPRP